MKFLAVCAFLILAVANVRAEVTKEEAIAIVAGCKEEFGASDAEFEEMVKHQPLESTEGKCMLACTLKKFGVMSDEGKLLKEASIELSKHLINDEDKKELVTEAIETCDGLDVSDDHCEAASEYSHCVITEFESKGIDSIDDLA